MEEPLQGEDRLCQHEEDHGQLEPVDHALRVLEHAHHPQDGGQDDAAPHHNRRQDHRLVVLPKKVYVFKTVPENVTMIRNHMTVHSLNSQQNILHPLFKDFKINIYASNHHLLFYNRHGANGKENDAGQEEYEEVDEDKKVKIVVVSTKHLVQQL